ncbi:DDE Tnp4 domain-containing protein [Mycena kentingensis (nom. inval.)]|nr:DDE Tnp4 domain-containing protein [Mycena kentingensis (nom. inval.)]
MPPPNSHQVLAVLPMLLQMEDDDDFTMREMLRDDSNNDDVTLLAAALPPPAAELGRPEIGGQKISLSWLRSLTPRECLYRFRFHADEIADLATAMQIPERVVTQNGCSFTRIEALGLLLARFRSDADLLELTTRYDRSVGAISQVVNELAIFLDEKWSHLLEFDTNGVLSPDSLQEYGDALEASGVPSNSIWGFIDCTIRCISRPSRFQRQAYSGHKKKHALKYQAVKAPNGHIAHLFGPMEGRRNDNALLHESGLEQLHYQHALRPGADARTALNERYYQVFGDPAYGVRPWLLSGYPRLDLSREEHEWNVLMAEWRIEVEHGFADVVRLWPFTNAWWKHRIWSSPVGCYYRVAVLLTNASNCLRPNQTSQYFNCQPPVLEEYFHT